jgi:hypothetical protein
MFLKVKFLELVRGLVFNRPRSGTPQNAIHPYLAASTSRLRGWGAFY